MKEKYSIYIHIPFCKARCGYCAFSSCTDYLLAEKYFTKLLDEIKFYSNKDESISTVYLGGGTPSSVETKYIDQLFAQLRESFDLSQVEEISVECNPESVTDDLLLCLKLNGVNRLSFGLQSTNDDTLVRIGRIHNYRQFTKALELANAYNFSNVNADLILGLPETVQEFCQTVERVANLPLQHVSVYALELHEGTGLHALCKDKYPFTEDELADLYDFTCEKLAEKGFLRYEISNFAQKDCECKHNLNYWKEGRYYAFGASACGFVANERYANPYEIRHYLTTPVSQLHKETDVLTRDDQANEFVMLGLRLSSGVSLDEFAHKYGVDFFSFFTNSNNLVKQGYLAVVDGNVVVPSNKLYVVNSILCELLEL